MLRDFLRLLLLVLPLTVHADPLPAPDRSLTVPAYMALGAPAPDQPWTVAQLRTTLKVLRKLSLHEPLKLPRRDNPESGKLFARLLSPDAGWKAPKTETTRDKITRQSAYLQTIGMVTPLYVQGAQQGTFDAELTALTDTSLRESAKLLELLQQEKKEPKKMKRPRVWKRDLKQATFSAAFALRGAVYMYAGRGLFRPAERQKLRESLVKWLPILAPQVLPKDRQQLHTLLTGVIREERDPARLKEWTPIVRVLDGGKQSAEQATKPGKKPHRMAKKHR